MSDWKEIAQFAQEIAREAGHLIRQERDQQTVSLNYKTHQELVTSADLKSDQLIRSRIQQRFPEHQILSEELAPDYSSPELLQSQLWIIDPIDGTVNYARNHQMCAVSIAYAEAGQVRIGAVYCPFLEELFHVIQGEGSYLNEQRLQITTQTELRGALIGTGFPYNREERPKLIPKFQKMLESCGDIRRIGAASLDICWIAAGRMDGFFETLSPWDFAAAQLVVREAGGKIGHIGEVPPGVPPELYGLDLIVGAPAIFDEMQQVLRSA
jgi:myo-inositol-1(or 4)-monophosphatase